MPEWLAALTVGEIVGWVVGLSGFTVLLVKIWKPLAKIFKTVSQFVEDWNGTEDRTDHSGAVIEKGKPGVPALLEKVRAQVENSHSTNLRDDVDELSEKSMENTHKIEEIARSLQKHIDQTDQWTPMITELHEQYVGKKRPRPEQPTT